MVTNWGFGLKTNKEREEENKPITYNTKISWFSLKTHISVRRRSRKNALTKDWAGENNTQIPSPNAPKASLTHVIIFQSQNSYKATPYMGGPLWDKGPLEFLYWSHWIFGNNAYYRLTRKIISLSNSYFLLDREYQITNVSNSFHIKNPKN